MLKIHFCSHYFCFKKFLKRKVPLIWSIDQDNTSRTKKITLKVWYNKASDLFALEFSPIAK